MNRRVVVLVIIIIFIVTGYVYTSSDDGLSPWPGNDGNPTTDGGGGSNSSIHCDINCDGCVDIYDMILVSGWYNKPSPDINLDGVVTDADLDVIGSAFTPKGHTGIYREIVI